MREPDPNLAEEQARIQDAMAMDQKIRSWIGKTVKVYNPNGSSATDTLLAFDGKRAWLDHDLICWMGPGSAIRLMRPPPSGDK